MGLAKGSPATSIDPNFYVPEAKEAADPEKARQHPALLDGLVVSEILVGTWDRGTVVGRLDTRGGRSPRSLMHDATHAHTHRARALMQRAHRSVDQSTNCARVSWNV